MTDSYGCFQAEDFSGDPTLDELTTVVEKASKRSGGRSGPGLLRYPGGKTNVVGQITSRLQAMFAGLSPSAEYREPFIGSGAVAISLLQRQPGPAWINDRDPAMAALWDSVINRSDSLKLLVTLFSDIINVNYFYYYKKYLCSIVNPEDLQRFDPGWVALAKLAVHQMSFSGLGTCAGGPLGGRSQRGQSRVYSRYNAELLCTKIDSCRDILSTVPLRNGICTCLDFEELFSPGEAVIYLDPPYYEAGPELYQHSFHHNDHVRLAGLLRKETRPWLLSYDANPAILDLYSWARIEEIEVPYPINGCEKKVELLISNS
jgi:DNA adenine methylase